MRHYKRPTERGTFTKRAMTSAVELVIQNGCSIRKAAKENDVNYKTVQICENQKFTWYTR